MKRLKIVVLTLLLSFVVTSVQAESGATAASMSGFVEGDVNSLDDSYARMMSKDWALVSAGDAASFNTMTISWGTLGSLWRKPVVTIYIKPSRYTHQFIEQEQRVTISLFGGNHKEDLLYLGRNSGRDGDKLSKTSLSAVFTPSGLPTFQQAEVVIEGRKLYKSRFEAVNFVDEQLRDRLYSSDPDDFHDAYIFEVERVWIKK